MSDNWNTFVKMKEKTEGWDRYSDGSAGQVSEEWSKANKSKMKAAKPPSEFSVGRKGATQLTKAIPKTGVFLRALGPIGALIGAVSDLVISSDASKGEKEYLEKKRNPGALKKKTALTQKNGISTAFGGSGIASAATSQECTSEVCVVPIGGNIDWAKEERQWDRADVEDEKFYRMKKHSERKSTPNKQKKNEGN